MSYNSLEEIVRECQEKDLPFDEVILLDDMNERNVSREESIETMRGMWEAMKGAERNYDGSLQSRSGLVGGAGKTMRAYVESGNTLCGPFVGKVMASALAMGESNACMKRIVAAPTAGACGVLPAVLVNYQKEKGTADEQIEIAVGMDHRDTGRQRVAGTAGNAPRPRPRLLRKLKRHLNRRLSDKRRTQQVGGNAQIFGRHHAQHVLRLHPSARPLVAAQSAHANGNTAFIINITPHHYR